MIQVIASGSSGNAVIYHDRIMVDIGVPYSDVKPYVRGISLILLTHEHNDHLNINTLKRLQFERPALRVGCGKFLIEHLDGIKNVDVYEVGVIYNYGSFKIIPVILYHDVPNFGYRIFKDDMEKIFHATDTAHLQGITAKNYSIYALECNYDEEHVYDVIREKQMNGLYAHQRGSINSHLSVQQAQNFVLRNGTPGKYQFIQLHQSSEF